MKSICYGSLHNRSVSATIHCRREMADASGLAPMAPTSPPSSRMSEPSLNATLMERMQTTPMHTPKFVFGEGSSPSSFDFDSPLGGTSVYHHPKYYMDTDMIVFQVIGHKGCWRVVLIRIS